MNSVSFSEKRFLIVEDARATRITMMKMLKPYGDPSIENAENGLEAISVLSNPAIPIDCAIVDFNMPVMHGLTLVKDIRTGEHGIERNVPILMITSHGDKNLLGLALALDVNGFLLKPLSQDTLVSRLATILNRSEGEMNWVKPVDSYKWIDVETAMQLLLHKPSASFNEYNMKKINHAITRTKDRQRTKQQIESALQHHDAMQTPEPIAGNRPKHGYSVQRQLRYVAPGSVLAKELVGKNGQKLLRLHTVLTEEMLDRLKDLSTIGEEVHDLWVFPPLN